MQRLEHYHKYATGRTNAMVDEINQYIDKVYAKGGKIPDSFFLLQVARLSEQNVNKDRRKPTDPNTIHNDFHNIEGGPFAALIVQYEGGLDENRNGIGKPRVIGIGANHVVPEHDPSAHGEMCAIRDASHRLGYTDLSNTVMHTSCECCPHCQGAATAAGIKKIVYANTREQADKIGFSDEQQYALIQDPFKYMTQFDRLPENNELFKIASREEILELLKTNEAIVISGEKILALGHVELQSENVLKTSPTIDAIREACKLTGHFHLPEDTILICKKAPHPSAFTVADWARIGRRRGADPLDPHQDKKEKDASKIIYVNPEIEDVYVRDKNGNMRVVASGADILADINKAPEDRTIAKTHRTDDKMVQQLSERAFKIWKELTGQTSAVKY